ncbi:hypothetical protein D049_3499A, partial [Vibrio parahaemolyticus VPTS-2010]
MFLEIFLNRLETTPIPQATTGAT